jgi:glycosyltransferase involved in cell wall biosynthesis
VFVHYHGGAPAMHGARHLIERIALGGVDAALFTHLSQAQPWLDAGLLEQRQVAQLVETSSPFSGLPRDEARARMDMTGDPVYLSAGRLHPIKDPMTMLHGFASIVERQPGARLYLYYLTGELLDAVREFVQSVPGLAERVEFRGRAPAADMEAIYSSADFLLQASLREWSGLAVLEAMSCGCIPIVSRIPSFTAMTGEGTFGRHFAPGDAEELAAAALGVSERGALSERVRHHFRQELSFAAMAARLEALYQRPQGDA